MMSNFTLSVAQSRVWNDPSRGRVVIAGRRFGKTALVIRELWRAATKARNQNVWMCSPSYSQVRDLAWNDLIRMIPRRLMSKQPNSSRLEIPLINGSMITLKGTGNVDTLLGRGINFLALDEFPLMDEQVWNLLRPSLADTEGKFLMTGTPRGYNWAYDLYEQGTPGWIPTQQQMDMKGFIDPRTIMSSHQYSTLQGGNVSREEIQIARQTMSQAMYAQEFLASFQALSGRVVCNYDPTRHLDESITYNKDMPILAGIDFNVSPGTAVLGQIRNVNRGGKKQRELHIFDEVYIENSNTAIVAAEISNRYPGANVICYPDASGNARKTSAETNKTDHSILASYGFNIQVDNTNPYIVDRINSTNALFKNKAGQERCYVHPRCKYLQRTLNGLCYKEGTSLPDKDGGLDHLNDSLGYLINRLFGIATVGSFSTSMGLG